jgi:hypothetical protein
MYFRLEPLRFRYSDSYLLFKELSCGTIGGIFFCNISYLFTITNTIYRDAQGEAQCYYQRWRKFGLRKWSC